MIRWRSGLIKIAPILAVLGMWEFVSRMQWVNPFFIPPFAEVIRSAWRLTSAGVLPWQTLISLERALAGLVIAIVVGIPLGILVGNWFRLVGSALEPVLDFCAQINPFIFFHIILLFLGIGEMTQITMIAWTCIWPIVFSTMAGIRQIDPSIIKATRAFGVTRFQLIYKVTIPAAGPAIFTGIRISAGYAFFMLIAAEMMGCSSGLGWFIRNSQDNYQVTHIFAGAIVIALLGLGVDLILQAIEKRLIVTADDPSPNVLATRLARWTSK